MTVGKPSQVATLMFWKQQQCFVSKVKRDAHMEHIICQFDRRKFKCMQGIVCQLKIINNAYKQWYKMRQTCLKMKPFSSGLFDTFMQSSKYAGLKEY